MSTPKGIILRDIAMRMLIVPPRGHLRGIRFVTRIIRFAKHADIRVRRIRILPSGNYDRDDPAIPRGLSTNK